MNKPPRFSDDYTDRQTEAARRVLVDIVELVQDLLRKLVG